MMRMNNIQLKTRVKVPELLAVLRENAERHKTIVKEARAGYMKSAREALAQRLEQLEKGKIVNLSFSLHLPEDYSEVYRTTIAMLEQTVDETIELAPDEFRQLFLDEWDWTPAFLRNSSRFSTTATEYGLSKRVIERPDDEVFGGAVGGAP